jgi:succinate dehydrogenase hydrophobic anchor subunit
MDELFSLLQIKRHYESDRFDAVIVDCAPTGETLRLLGFPDIARWWHREGVVCRGSRLVPVAASGSPALAQYRLRPAPCPGEHQAFGIQVLTIADDGIAAIDFAFVAGKWSSPFWQVWDLLMLWLAQLHGTNGLRTIINDYAERDQTRFWLKMLLYTATVVVLFLGTLTIFTFDPCIAGSTYEFCPAD